LSVRIHTSDPSFRPIIGQTKGPFLPRFNPPGTQPPTFGTPPLVLMNIISLPLFFLFSAIFPLKVRRVKGAAAASSWSGPDFSRSACYSLLRVLSFLGCFPDLWPSPLWQRAGTFLHDHLDFWVLCRILTTSFVPS